MCKVTISLLQLFERFPNQDTARAYMEQKRWPAGAWCPHCGERTRIGSYKDGYYRCNVCMEMFTVRTQTVMERSHIPLHKWLYGMYLLVTARKGISSVQLSKELGISQPSAWFRLQRLRVPSPSYRRIHCRAWTLRQSMMVYMAETLPKDQRM